MGQEEILRKLTGMTSSRCTPEIVTSLKPNEVFVFGSNQEGEHKSPAAKLAVKQFGAMMGCGEGLFGQSYAIPVHKHRRSKMVKAVAKFIDFAKENIDKNFLVLTIGCGSAGMDAAFVALMFRKAIEVENIFLPKLFIDELIRYYEIGLEISEDCMTLSRYPMDRKGEYSVPYGVEIIGRGAFEGCAGLDVKLPESLKRIEEYAFSDMGLFDYYLRIPSSVSYIDDNAFTSEYVSPRLLVNYQSCAYDFAKRDHRGYKCVDFDEGAFLKKKKEEEELENRGAHSLRNFFSNHQHNYFLHSNSIASKGQIAIARDFAVVLNDDGHLTLLGHNDDFRQIDAYERIVKVAATFKGYMGLTESGKVVFGNADEHEYYVAQSWSGVKDIIGCEDHVLAVLQDGSVVCADGPGDWTFSPMHEKTVREWKNIQQIAAGFANVMGLTRDGRVLYHSEDGYTDPHFYDNYSDVVQIDCYSHYYGTDSSMVLHRDGTVSSDTFKGVDSWRDIIQISVGADIAIGLKSDGTIEMADLRDTRYEAKRWKNLVCIECKFFAVVGITREGQILSLFSQP